MSIADFTPINWFPGHMHKATKEIKQLLPSIDVIIEVLDARVPYSSQNPVITELDRHKDKKNPRIKLLNKADLADPNINRQWLAAFNTQTAVKTVLLQATQLSDAQSLKQTIIGLCHELVPNKIRVDDFRRIRAMIVGIPNVGKSTIMNALLGRKIAKTGNEPAVTKAQEKHQLTDDIILFDTPGILWPKFYNQHLAYRLALTGAIKPTAFTFDDVGFFTVDYLLQAYPELLKTRYQLSNLPESDIDFFEIVGRQKRYFSSGQCVDYTRLGELVVMDFRQGLTGRISLETPETMAEDIQLTEQLIVEAQANKAAKQAARLQKKKRVK